MGAEEMIKQQRQYPSPFNSSLETGIRTLVLLETAYPISLSLERLIEFDYLVVHSGDAGGPESLHAPLPLRTGELLVRRSIIESGLDLMMSRGLVERVILLSGISYKASEAAGPFLNALSSSYISSLRERALWVIVSFGQATEDELIGVTRKLFDKWTTQFQQIELSYGR